jgi:hypothetical protein
VRHVLFYSLIYCYNNNNHNNNNNNNGMMGILMQCPFPPLSIHILHILTTTLHLTILMIIGLKNKGSDVLLAHLGVLVGVVFGILGTKQTLRAMNSPHHG